MLFTMSWLAKVECPPAPRSPALLSSAATRFAGSPKDARKLREKPTRGTEAPAALARLVDLGVGARGEGFEVAAQLRLGGKGGDAPEVGGDLLVEQVKALRLVEGELAIGLSLEPVEGRLQLRPRRALGGDEAREVDDHERKMTRDGQMKPAARMSSGRARA